MALITTVGGETSDSYVSYAEYAAYWLARGVTVGIEAASDVLLRRAADALGRNYAYNGYKAAYTQALAWPRITSVWIDGYLTPSDVVPQAIKDAQCELAYLISQGADPFKTIAAGGNVTSESVAAGPVSSSKTYSGGATRDTYTAISGLIGPYLASGGLGSGQVRFARG